ncbi:hypothetical protein [Haloprofundus sp. MHR1]|uniref:DUF7344 domain-containing protein n=1 Tax=Haloprofundus sp. MHR1 TaxID=2572921 RepID=UPI0010BF66DB|nr:hypothetical protein [Haloprofundus sp. MHR1]QCJ47805.1 hypothetical protein FCF25_12050 [Haloprofundus sp. MHR1]
MTDEQSSATADDVDELSQLLAVLSHPRRRQVVTLLSDDSHPSTLTELVAAIRTLDSPTPTAADREASLHLSLHHVHLPKLTDAGFVEYDTASRTLTPGRRLVGRDTDQVPSLAAHFDDERTGSGVRLFSTTTMRATLAALDTDDEELDVSDVAAALSARVGGSPQTHAAHLVHSLLPKLAEAGVVDYDADRGTVSLRYRSPPLGGSSSPAHP